MSRVTWNDSDLIKDAQKRALDGCEELAFLIKTDAMEHCPVAEENGGTLRNSHVIERRDAERAVVIGVGGAAAPYAEIQHERLDFHHTTGEAKWLENAFNRHVGELPEYIKKHLKQ
jgi:hypothetical protein